MPTIHPVVDEGLGNSAYVVELGDGRALVVDPARDPTPYLELARWRRLRIAYAVETHLHADFLTGSRELAAADGAQVLAPRTSRLGFSHRGLEGGEEADLGGLTLRALATPGHAPEHVSYLLADDGRPQALFSGGALLVGTVARTDLASPELTEPLARAAYRSLHQRLLSLPDDLGVYPTHGTGSFCATPAGDQRTTTIGAERRHNRLLAAADEDAFVAQLLAGFGGFPPYFLRLRDRNRVGPDLLGRDWRVLPLLSTDRVRAHLAGGGLLVDARPVEAFAAGHIPGALSIALRPQLASWLGWLVDDTQPLVFVLDEDQDRGELVRQCRTIGYDHLIGELAGGMAAWQDAHLPEAQLPLIQAERLDQPGVVLDVRQASEITDGHLPGAVTVELGALGGDRLPAQLPQGPVTVMCAHGERAMTAASLLERAGHKDLRVVHGGPEDWQRATGKALTRS
jgi:glyoxylase-like metal-dependent hydrolase (beta-lactamase superfamily II)/rhodanese-related sulfurtransferase